MATQERAELAPEAGRRRRRRSRHEAEQRGAPQENDRPAERQGGDAIAGNCVMRSADDGTGRTIEELVDEAVINLDDPCENLPIIWTQELKIIGRCVTFMGETTVDGDRILLYYEGIVAMITKDTVMLLQVRRYTKEDFLKYQETLKAKKREAHKRKANRELRDEVNTHGSENVQEDEEIVSFPVSTHLNSNDDNNVVNGGGCNLLLPRHATADETEGPQHGEPPVVRESRFLGAGSIGPVPYMTFSRRCIRNVLFGRDPQSSFYSLFEDPSKRNFDLQCLRMFVRRYLVHTSQGNNLRKINLRAFIEWRCNCKCQDDELIIKIAKQELAYLLKTEREMTKAAERLANNRRNFLNSYEPSHRLFRFTGILYLTRIPVQTFTLAVLELVMSLLLLGFSAYAFATAPELVIYGYIKEYTFAVIFSGTASFLAGGMTALHSLRMRLPLTFTIYSVFRFLSATVAIVLDIMMLVMIGEAMSPTHILEYLLQVAQESSDLCRYYIVHNCTGFGQSCGAENMSPLCMQGWCQSNRNLVCTQPLASAFVRFFIPFVVISMVLIPLFAIDHFLHYRLVHTSRMLMTRI